MRLIAAFSTNIWLRIQVWYLQELADARYENRRLRRKVLDIPAGDDHD